MTSPTELEASDDNSTPSLRQEIKMLGSWSDGPTQGADQEGDGTQTPSLKPVDRTRRGPISGIRSILSWRPNTVLAILLAAGVGLVLLDLSGTTTQPVRDLGQSIGGEAQRWADDAIGPLRDLPERRSDPIEYEQRVEELEARNNVLEAERAALIDQKSTEAQSAELRKSSSALDVKVVPAHVVASAAGITSNNSVTLDIGTNSGIEPNLSVVADGALVGRLTEVGPNTSTLLLITDPSNRIWARTQSSRAAVVVDGTNSGLHLGLVNQFVSIADGELVETMGSPNGRPYPRGIPIGTISSITGDEGASNRTVSVEPIANVEDLDLVGIVTKQRRSS